MTWDLLITVTIAAHVLALVVIVTLLCLAVVRADDRLIDDLEAADDEDTVVLLRAWRDEVQRP